jgi:hypothetical protein
VPERKRLAGRVDLKLRLRDYSTSPTGGGAGRQMDLERGLGPKS